MVDSVRHAGTMHEEQSSPLDVTVGQWSSLQESPA